MGLSIVSPPAAVITRVAAKLHLKQNDIDADDALIDALIPAATIAAENYTGRAFVSRTLRQTFQGWCLELETPPHRSVTAVRYVDEDGATQTLAADQYQADLSGDQPAVIVPAYGVTWPTFRCETLNPVTVDFVAGYGAAEDVPAPIIAAIKMLLGHVYVNREAVNIGNITTEIPMGVRFLLDHYRVLIP